VLPITKVLPIPMARGLFRLAQPLAFPLHCRPLNKLRTENGLASLGSDLRKVYTDADHTLYADDPKLFPIDAMPAADHHLGPILWSPRMPAPDAWTSIDASRPTVYLTLGSSGSAKVARKVFAAVAETGVNLIVASAGAAIPAVRHSRAFVSEFVPGDAAVALSQLVICNGGSPTSQQALAAGVPVLGIAGNMDQFLNMDGLVRAGAGCVMRADRISGKTLAAKVEVMLADLQMRAIAVGVGKRFSKMSLEVAFAGFLDTVLR
jgi:UDP:flavonoid glycosyltransferase YjiC (YdhE family)